MTDAGEPQVNAGEPSANAGEPQASTSAVQAGAERRKRDLIDQIMVEATRSDLFSPQESLVVRATLERLSLQELVGEYLPRWFGDLWRWQPVGVEEWLFSPDFMNLRGNIWPKLVGDLIELLEGGYQEAVLEGSIGWGKCSSQINRVVCSVAHGPWGLQRLGDIVAADGDVRVLGLTDSGRLQPVEVTNKAQTGVKPVFDLLLKSGKRLKATAEHPIRTPDGFMPLNSLRPGDLVATAAGDWLDPTTLIGSTIAWNPVASITPAGVEPVFDLEVPSVHNYLIEGMVVHNSYLTSLVLLRKLYEISCFKEPQLALGLGQGTPIVMANIATKEKVAREVVFGYVQTYVRSSPYFMQHFPPDKDLVATLKFPNSVSIAPAASTQGSVIGQNIFSAVVDEANFLFRGQSTRGGELNEDYSLAKVLWTALQRRIESRFGRDHRGVLLLVSSALYPDDFTTWRVQEAERLGERVFHRRYSQWDTKPDYADFTKDPQKFFWLSVGDLNHRPRILRSENEPDFDATLDDRRALEANDVRVIPVPLDFKLQFNRDIDMAVRDIAGFATQSRYPFIRNMRSVQDSLERGRGRGLQHPWTLESTTLFDGGAWIRENLDTKRASRHHFAHVDLGLTRDAAGIAVVRLDGLDEQVVETPVLNDLTLEIATERVKSYAPKLTSVLLLRVVGSPNREVPVGRVRQLLVDLLHWGFNLSRVTYDRFNSAESLQALQHMGVDADYQSVDRTMEPYNALREALEEDRLDLYDYPPLIKELSQLELDVKRKKVDHPSTAGASKDVADSLAASVFNATTFVRTNEGILLPGAFDDEPATVNVLEFGQEPDEDVDWLFA